MIHSWRLVSHLMLALNLVIGTQMNVYWGRTAGQEGTAKVRDEMLRGAAKMYDREKVNVVVQPQSPLPQQAHERSQSAAYGRKSQYTQHRKGRGGADRVLVTLEVLFTCTSSLSSEKQINHYLSL